MRSTLLRSRKSSSRGSAGSSTSMTFVRSRCFRRRWPTSDRRPQQRLALVGFELGQPPLQPFLAGAALGFDELSARLRHRHQHLTAVGGVRASLDETRVRPARRSPGSSTAAARVHGRPTHPASSRPPCANVASADNCDSDTGDSGRRKRNCRANRMTASDKSLASRASASFTWQRVPTSLPEPTKHDRLTSVVSDRLGWSAMAATTPAQPDGPEPPAVARCLLEPWPVIVAIAAGWLIAVVLAFTVPDLHELAAGDRGRARRRGAWHVDLSVAASRGTPRFPRCAERPMTHTEPRTEEANGAAAIAGADRHRCTGREGVGADLRLAAMPRWSPQCRLMKALGPLRQGTRTSISTGASSVLADHEHGHRSDPGEKARIPGEHQQHHLELRVGADRNGTRVVESRHAENGVKPTSPTSWSARCSVACPTSSVN